MCVYMCQSKAQETYCGGVFKRRIKLSISWQSCFSCSLICQIPLLSAGPAVSRDSCHKLYLSRFGFFPLSTPQHLVNRELQCAAQLDTSQSAVVPIQQWSIQVHHVMMAAIIGRLFLVTLIRHMHQTSKQHSIYGPPRKKCRYQTQAQNSAVATTHPMDAIA